MRIRDRLNNTRAEVRGARSEVLDMDGNPQRILNVAAELDQIAAAMQNSYAVYSLSTDQTIPLSRTTTVLFERVDTGQSDDNVLSDLGLSLNNGVFRNMGTGTIILLVSYQLRFADPTSIGSGFRQGFINVDNILTLARTQTQTLIGQATHITGCAPVRLAPQGTFTVEAFHNNRSDLALVTASSGTKLVICGL